MCAVFFSPPGHPRGNQISALRALFSGVSGYLLLCDISIIDIIWCCASYILDASFLLIKPVLFHSPRHDQSQRGVTATTLASREPPPQVIAAVETDAVASGKETNTSSMMKMLLELNGRDENATGADETSSTAKALANIRLQVKYCYSVVMET